ETRPFELLDRGPELLLDFPDVVVLAQPHLLARELPEIELEPVPPVEPLVEEPKRAPRWREGEREVEVQVEPLQVLGLEAPEDDAVPGEGGEGKLALSPRKLPPPAGLEVHEAYVVEDVEMLVDPGLVFLVPPRLLVAQRHT